MKKFIALVIILMIIIAGTYVGSVSYNGYQLYLKTMDGVDIEETFKLLSEDEHYVSIDTLPSAYINAVVSVEDHRFFEHNGFDTIAFIKAIVRNVQENDFATGGSTITQQLAKNLFFSFEKKMERKVAELIVAKEIEALFEKDEILEAYVNIIYFGNSFEGIYDASMGYFKKEPSRLTEAEAVLLAGLPQAPSTYALFEHLDLAVERSKIVLEAMLDKGYLTETQKNSIFEEIQEIKIQVD